MAQAVAAMAGVATVLMSSGGAHPPRTMCVTEHAAGGLARRLTASKVPFSTDFCGIMVRRRKAADVAATAAGDVFFSKTAAIPSSLKDDESAGSEDMGETGLEERELKDYPPGFRRYETMAVLRPDISEDQRLALTQRYEEAIIASGGLDVEMFNRGMQPLAYNITTRNMSGVSNRYLDGIYLLFTYAAKPDSQLGLQKRLNSDDDIIRSTSFRLKN